MFKIYQNIHKKVFFYKLVELKIFQNIHKKVFFNKNCVLVNKQKTCSRKSKFIRNFYQ